MTVAPGLQAPSQMPAMIGSDLAAAAQKTGLMTEGLFNPVHGVFPTIHEIRHKMANKDKGNSLYCPFMAVYLGRRELEFALIWV
jgi:hypothetical protein